MRVEEGWCKYQGDFLDNREFTDQTAVDNEYDAVEDKAVIAIASANKFRKGPTREGLTRREGTQPGAGAGIAPNMRAKPNYQARADVKRKMLDSDIISISSHTGRYRSMEE